MIEQSFLYKETQEPEQNVFISEHIPYFSSELRGLDEKTSNKCSILNPAENDIKENFTHLPPHKNEQECIPGISEQKLIIHENDLEVRVYHYPCRPQTCIYVSNFNMDKSASQPKRKVRCFAFSSTGSEGKGPSFSIWS